MTEWRDIETLEDSVLPARCPLCGSGVSDYDYAQPDLGACEGVTFDCGLDLYVDEGMICMQEGCDGLLVKWLKSRNEQLSSETTA